ncbi:hypothetical protein JNB_17298 [Janibacter sp. HTCC2649]|nr:hypothetical protein JNB_17298 [Janibacter sp. HTCC2649]
MGFLERCDLWAEAGLWRESLHGPESGAMTRRIATE